ncbi:MAG TPA: glycoside hydrolase family 43 protein [Tepidisphaeraceae bacterium]
MSAQTPTTSATSQPRSPSGRRYLSQPLVTSIYTADPSAHVFGGRIYVYVSHDISEGPPLEDVEPFKGSSGNGFKMRDYVVLSMDHVGGEVTVHSNALDIKDVRWAARQMWAPDAAYKDGTYFLYFPAKARDGAFRIGVATSKNPAGPFAARPEPIKGSYSIDPAVFTDDDGQSYMYFGGLSGGQLQMNTNGVYDPAAPKSENQPKDQPALMPKVAKMRPDMLEFAETPRDAVIVDESGKPLLGGDGARRFFEASWMHKYKGKYYFSYSTGGTHFIAYAVGDSPYGPFTYRGNVLLPVQGWTTHHSIVEIGGRWWLFYADSQLSDKTSLRNVKVTELFYNPDGTIRTIDPFLND